MISRFFFRLHLHLHRSPGRLKGQGGLGARQGGGRRVLGGEGLTYFVFCLFIVC